MPQAEQEPLQPPSPEHPESTARESDLTLRQMGVKNPFIAAAKTASLLLGGQQALHDYDDRVKLSELIVERTKAAHADFAFEATHALMAQVVILEAIISRYAGVMGLVTSEESMALCLDATLRAQGELRKTLLAIDQIKNPKKPTQFIKQYVSQQLNQLRLQQPELSHEQPFSLPASERPEATFTDSRVEAVGEIDRPQVSSRKTARQPKRRQAKRV